MVTVKWHQSQYEAEPKCLKHRSLNELVKYQNVNCSSKYSILFIGIFAVKMWVAFANAKATHIFSAKILTHMPYLMIKVLTIRWLTTSLVLNNWALVIPITMQLDLGRLSDYSITKTYLYNFDPLKPHFYIVKLGFTGVYNIILFLVKKHRLWVLVRTASPRRF